MSTIQWVNTNREYYRSNLINYGLPTDIIGIIVLFTIQNPSIDDLVNAPVYKNYIMA